MINKIFVFSSYLWAVACYAFVGIVMMMTKFFTVDPTLGAGAPEHDYLLPMLSIVGVGIVSFGLVVLSWVVSKFKKIKVSGKHFFIAFALNCVLGIVTLAYMFGIGQKNRTYQQQSYTGQQLFDEVNLYRVANGVPALELKLDLCDNLVARYLKIKNEDNAGHSGFEEWARAEGIDKKYAPVGELYTKNQFTTKDAVEWWATSPGHRLTLLLDEVSMGCAYADKGTGVLIVGEPIKK